MHGIKQDTKIELEQIKPYSNVYLKNLLEHLYILINILTLTLKPYIKHQNIIIKVLFEVEI